MKRKILLAAFMLVTLFACAFGLSACGEEWSNNRLTYALSDDKTSYIVRDIGTCKDTDIVIPSTYKGLPVTSIGDSAFVSCDSLTSIVIPDSVTSIGDSAFYNCYELTSIVIPDSVTSIGDSAFVRCYSLTSIVIPDGVTSIGERAFLDCDSLTSVVIPDGVTEIGDSAFSGCDSLTSIVIPDSVTSIGESAFSGCYKLIEVYNISSLNITAESENNGYVAYYAKDVYTSTSTQSKLTTTDDGYIFYDDTANGNGYYLIEYMGTATALTLPDKYNGSNYSIYWYAFENCDSLTSVTIPDGVTSIGDYAFEDCSSLTSVTIGNGVTSIGNYVFEFCSSLTSVSIGNGVTSISEYTFAECTSLKYNEYDNAYYLGNDSNPYVVLMKAKSYDITSCTINEKTKIIYYGAFHRCRSLTSITIPDGVTEIGYGAFSNCSGMTSVVIPDSVTSIGDWAFEYCTSLTSVTIGNGVTSIGNLFYECYGLTSIVIPDGVTSIGDDAFAYCSELTSITIPNSVNYIGDSAFYNCFSLKYNEDNNAYYLGNESNPYVVLVKAKSTYITSCTINEKTKIIYYRAFYYCTSLTSITIPDSVTSIGDDAFAHCSGLTNVIFKNTSGWDAVLYSNHCSISSADLADPATAAEYLTDTYRYSDWVRS